MRRRTSYSVRISWGAWIMLALLVFLVIILIDMLQNL